MKGAVSDPFGYEILGELGRGGMGIVYKARDLQRDRLVALKMIPSGRGAVILELARFRIEAEAIASLAHPNIVRIHAVGVHLGYPYFALEFASGGCLAERIRGQPMPCDWTSEVTQKLALAMQHAHERGIVHRDLKPSNILMMSGDVPKITDFGLAKFTTAEEYWDSARSGMTISLPRAFLEMTQLRQGFRRLEVESRDGAIVGPPAEVAQDRSTAFQDYVIRSEWGRITGAPELEGEPRLSEIRRFIQDALEQASCELAGDSPARARLTGAGAIMGTPQYMAPEQAWGETDGVGPSADIYALGAIIYEMLTGQPPFTGDSYQVIVKARSQPPVPPRQRRDSVDPSLEAICLKCLEKTPERRYESMKRLAEDLGRFLGRLEVSALRERLSDSRPVDAAIGPRDIGETRTWIPDGTTEPGSGRVKSWWQFWK
jgi:serine/threonine protein kinase